MIPIIPFTKNKDDRELLKLKEFLLLIKDHHKVTDLLDAHFKLEGLSNHEEVHAAVKHLLQ